jgi:ectoine hydroxylase-related dioxygenase (phytanoyl-CoA dioxygenase family)
MPDNAAAVMPAIAADRAPHPAASASPAPDAGAHAHAADTEAAHAAALAALHAHPGALDGRQRAALERDGYLLLPAHFTGERLECLRAAHDRLMAQKYPVARPSPEGGAHDFWHHEVGTRRLCDLASEDPVFDLLYTDPVVLAAVQHLHRRPFKLDSINAREAMPGYGEQNWHRDHDHALGGLRGVNTGWFLDDVVPESGPTRVIPGSHAWPEGPGAMTEAIAARETQVLGPAGTVLVFACTLWHSGTRNRGTRGRRLVHTSFVPREVDLKERAQHLRIRKATWERLPPAARWVLAV